MATTAGAKKGLWSTIRRIAASDRISGLIMLGFALTGWCSRICPPPRMRSRP